MRTNSIALVLLPVFWPSLPPLNLAVLKGFLQKNAIPADTVDFNNYFFNRVTDQIREAWKKSCNVSLESNIVRILKEDYGDEFRSMLDKLLAYDSVGFSCYKSNFPAVQEITRLLKAEKPGLRVILGGPEITRRYFKSGGYPGIEDKCVDFFVVGEGEMPLKEYLRSGRSDKKISVFEELQDLRSASVPDYSDFDFKEYPRKTGMSLLFSRGCIRKCAFCAERLLYKRFRICPIRTVIDTIQLYKKKGIQNFIFHDSLINGNLPALEKLCDEIIKNFGAVNWEAQIAVRRDMPDRLFRKIKESGCYHLFVGLESGSDAVLKAMRKGFTAQEAANFFRQMNYAGLSFGVSMIVGFPGETEKNFEESLGFLIKNKDLIPKIEQINPFVYYDGTGMREEADYTVCPGSLERARVFIERIKQAGFKCTNAFMLNLVEQRGQVPD